MVKNTFLTSNRYAKDCCAKDAKDAQNDSIANWTLYKHYYVPCEAPEVRAPTFQYDHPNLRASIGYGFTDGCVVDSDSSLRNNVAGLTRDRCRLQLLERLFQGCPNLKPTGDPTQELAVQQGQSSTNLEGTKYSCKRAIMEMTTAHPTPLVDCMADIQDPKHIVEGWTRGGDPTRDLTRRKEMLTRCGYGMKTLH